MVATILTFLVSFLIVLQTTLYPVAEVEQPNEPTTAAIEINLNQPMTDDPLERYLLEGLLKGITQFDIEELKNDVNLPDLTVIELVGKATQLVLQHPQIGSLYDVFVGPQNTTLEFNEIVTYGEALERRQALEEVITELLRGYDWKNMSDYEKSLQIHDIVIERAEYHYEAALANEGIGVNNDLDPAEVLETSTAHGALVNQRAICSGYAQAYQLLAQIVGLQSYYIEGSILVPVDDTEHAWNVVKLDNEWLVVDTTWDDTQTGKYAWMHLPSSFLESNRAATDIFIESIDEDLSSTTTDYTWFAKNDRVVTLENAIDVIEAWSKSGEPEASFLIGPISDLEKHKLVMEFQERFPDNSLHLSDMELLLVVTRSGIPR